MPSSATKPRHSRFPLGKQSPLSGQSLLWSCVAEAICSSWLLTVKWSSLFLATASLVCATLKWKGWFCFFNFLWPLSALKQSRCLNYTSTSNVFDNTEFSMRSVREVLGLWPLKRPTGEWFRYETHETLSGSFVFSPYFSLDLSIWQICHILVTSFVILLL